MILTCPVCTTRYMVAEGAIGTTGRRVRCAACGHQWTQEAEKGLDEELFGETPVFMDDSVPDTDDDFQDTDIGFIDHPREDSDDNDFESILRKEIESAPIPEGVRPVPEEYDPVLAQLGKQKPAAKAGKIKMPPMDKVTGFVVAACFYLCLLGVLLILQPQISRIWPASNMLYNIVGMKPVMPGEGLSLDGLQAVISDGKITMKGTIINLRESDTKVPAVLATIVGMDDQPIDQLLIPPPVARLKPEGQANFDVVYPKIPDGAKDVTFAFSFLKADPVKSEEPAEEKAQEEASEAPHGEAAPHAPEEHAPEAHAPEAAASSH